MSLFCLPFPSPFTNHENCGFALCMFTITMMPRPRHTFPARSPKPGQALLARAVKQRPGRRLRAQRPPQAGPPRRRPFVPVSMTCYLVVNNKLKSIR